MNNIIKDKQTGAFIETDCKFIHDGKSFQSGGSLLLMNKKTKLLEGILYAYPKENKVGLWNGSLKYEAKFLQTWKSAFIDFHGRNQINQLIQFKIENKLFRGIWYNKNWSDIIRVKEIKQ